jgi:Uma2 family endonuclease
MSAGRIGPLQTLKHKKQTENGPRRPRNRRFVSAFPLANNSPLSYQVRMTWAEICEDKLLARLPNRIESDRWGRIVMSPPPRSRHGDYQSEIAGLLRELLKGGRATTECPVQTKEGVKAADIAWASRERRASYPHDPVFLVAPEICVEVESPSDVEAELMERKQLFFEKGALEFWVCDRNGEMAFFDPAGAIPQSRLCPGFPKRILLD